MGAGGVGGAEDEVGAIAAEERFDSREGLHQVGAVVVSVVEHNNKVPGIRLYMSQMLYAGQSARPSVTFLSDF